MSESIRRVVKIGSMALIRKEESDIDCHCHPSFPDLRRYNRQ